MMPIIDEPKTVHCLYPSSESTLSLSNSELDTRFRSALDRMAESGRLQTYSAPVNPYLEAAGLMKKLDGGPAVLFAKVNGHDMPVIGNLLSCQANVEAAFGADFRRIRQFVGRALGEPKPPVLVERAPAQEQVHTQNIDIGRMLPALHHTADDAGRYITAGIVIARDPETGIYNASYHRLMLAGPNRAAIQLDYGRHLRAAFERAQKNGQHLPVVVCIGSDLALHYTAATMGSQMPENADELAVAGGLSGRPLPVVKAISQDLLVTAETEMVLQGAVPIVTYAEMTAGGLHRFHAVVQVKKTGPTHDGLQRNAIMASFGALKDLDMVIVVDDDIDIRDPADVEYALATRMEASKDIFMLPAARGHEYVRVSDRGMRTKLGIDATVPFAERARFARCEFKPVEVDSKAMTTDVAAARKRLDL